MIKIEFYGDFDRINDLKESMLFAIEDWKPFVEGEVQFSAIHRRTGHYPDYAFDLVIDAYDNDPMDHHIEIGVRMPKAVDWTPSITAVKDSTDDIRERSDMEKESVMGRMDKACSEAAATARDLRSIPLESMFRIDNKDELNDLQYRSTILYLDICRFCNNCEEGYL